MSSKNKALLDWAVKNIEEWREGYTHLRGDCSLSPIFFSVGDTWEISEYDSEEWAYDNHKQGEGFIIVERDTKFSPPQVITKEEWLNAKQQEEGNMGSTFSKKDLKTGMIVETKERDDFLVMLDTTEGDVLLRISEEGKTEGYLDLDDYDDNLILEDKYLQGVFDITKVFTPTRRHLNSLVKRGYCLLWERQPEPTPEQIKTKKLQETIDKLSEELENAQKQLNELNN